MKKTITTITLAIVLTFTATFANAGILVSDRSINDAPCTEQTKDHSLTGIIVEFVGIIVERTGIIVERTDCTSHKDGIIVERDGILVSD